MSDKPTGLAERCFRVCLMLLGCVIALNVAICLLRQIWIYLLLGVLVAVPVVALVWWLGRRGRW